MANRSLFSHAFPLPVGAVFVAATLIAGPALAADATRAPARGKADAILTPAQLRDCVAQKERLNRDTDAALRTKNQIVAEKAEIDRTGTALADEATSLDRTSSAAVDAYNAKVDERDRRIEAYQAKVSAYNKDAENVLAQKETYEKACENRRYDERDLSDLKKKK